MRSTFLDIWNFLWEYQIWIVFMLALILWIAIRFFDLGKWIWKKTSSKTQNSDTESADEQP